MKILRTFAKIILFILFSFFLSTTLLAYFLIDFTSYENLREIAIPIIESKINITEKEKTLALQYLKYLCKEKTEISFEFIKNITFNCSEILSLDEKNFTYFLAEKSFQTFYFEKYDCKIIDCFQKNQTYFLSNQFNNYLKENFSFLIILTLIFGISYFLILENFSSRLFSFGIIFIFIGISYFLIDFAFNFFQIEDEKIKEIVLMKIKDCSFFLPYFLVFGIVLLIIYIIFKIKKLNF